MLKGEDFSKTTNLNPFIDRFCNLPVRCCFTTNLERAKQIHEVELFGKDANLVRFTSIVVEVIVQIGLGIEFSFNESVIIEITAACLGQNMENLS